MTEEPHSIDAHLLGVSQEGEFFDEGLITLNPKKALEKLSKFSLPAPGLWVVKIVQAAVACGAPDIRFTFARLRVDIAFENREGWEARDLLATIVGGSAPSSRAINHLHLGIISAVGDGNDTVTWSCGRSACALSTEDLSSQEQEAQDLVLIVARRTARTTSLAHKRSSPLRYVLRQTAHEYKALIDRAIHSPIPVWVDGLELPRRYGHSFQDLPEALGFVKENSHGAGHLLAVHPVSKLERPCHLRYPIESDSPEQEPDEFSTLYSHTEDPNPQGVLCLFLGLQRRHTLTYLQDGILLERGTWSAAEEEPLNSIQSWRSEDLVLSLFLEAHPDELDLSTLQVRQQIPELCHVLLPSFLEIFEALKERCLLPWRFVNIGPLRANFQHGSVDGFLESLYVWPAAGLTVVSILPVLAVFMPFAYAWDFIVGKDESNPQGEALLACLNEATEKLEKVVRS